LSRTKFGVRPTERDPLNLLHPLSMVHLPLARYGEQGKWTLRLRTHGDWQWQLRQPGWCILERGVERAAQDCRQPHRRRREPRV